MNMGRHCHSQPTVIFLESYFVSVSPLAFIQYTKRGRFSNQKARPTDTALLVLIPRHSPFTIGKLAWNTYKSCRDAPGSFDNITAEVSSLHAILREVEEAFANVTLPERKRNNLKTILKGCQITLIDLQQLIDQYQSLGTQSKRTFDRLGWGSNNLVELRGRLTANMLMLNTFLSTSQLSVERKLDKLIQEFRDGKHEGSVISEITVDAVSGGEEVIWQSIRGELEDIGITVEVFDANKTFIMTWFRNSIATGAFEERPNRVALAARARYKREILCIYSIYIYRRAAHFLAGRSRAAKLFIEKQLPPAVTASGPCDFHTDGNSVVTKPGDIFYQSGQNPGFLLT